MSFPAYSGLLPNFIAAAAAAPEEMPTYKPESQRDIYWSKNMSVVVGQRRKG